MKRIIWSAIGIWLGCYVIVALALDPDVVWDQTLKSIQKPEFWVENLIVLALFGLLVGLIGYFLQQNETRRERRDFEGWSVLVIRDPKKIDQNEVAEESYIKPLSWREVRSYEESYVELRRFVQSVSSSENYTILRGKIEVDHKENWVWKDVAGRKYVFNFKHVTSDTKEIKGR